MRVLCKNFKNCYKFYIIIIFYVGKCIFKWQKFWKYWLSTTKNFSRTMGKKKDISAVKKQEILTLLSHSSKTIRDIANLAKVSIGTVHKIKTNMNNNANYTDNRKGRCGRKRLTTPREERKIEKICVNNRRISLAALKSEVNNAGITISPRTLQRRLKEKGFSCRRPARKPRLTEAMRKKRFEWAKKFEKWTEEDWEKALLNNSCKRT